MYKHLIRPLLFKFDPEKVHHLTFFLVKLFFNIPFVPFLYRKLNTSNNKKLETEVLGLKFNNPVGLAAGFDKDATLYNELANFGFGFIEIGTVTPKPQLGNPKKRLFRLLEDNGIINRMGFNNLGIDNAVKNLKKNKHKVIIGGNIGKNTGIPESQISDDYLECFLALHPYVDYFVVNVSCPNVGKSAQLEDKDFLIDLLNSIQSENRKFELKKPVLLKIAPDLNNQQLDQIVELVHITKIDGVVASNTSINRSNLKTSKQELELIGEQGGLSGKPIRDRSTKTIKYLAEKSNNSFTIIGVGGIHSEQDAIEKLEAGADLIQLYTGFIYEGPSLIKRINNQILTIRNEK